MRFNRPKKTIYTLCTDADYYKDLTDLTFPYIKKYADKIYADFVVISERKFPEWYITYEKLQIHEIEKDRKSDWVIYVDADALIHPDFFDITTQLTKEYVCHTAMDMASLRWRYDNYFLRDSRNIGSCNWFTVCSDWTIDLWEPITDMTLEETYSNIFPILNETNSGIQPMTLIDDYVLSRNIAKYGLKFKMVRDICEKYGHNYLQFLWHLYAIPIEEKIIRMTGQMNSWGIPKIPMEA